jgi:hypothetical protein
LFLYIYVFRTRDESGSCDHFSPESYW